MSIETRVHYTCDFEGCSETTDVPADRMDRQDLPDYWSRSARSSGQGPRVLCPLCAHREWAAERSLNINQSRSAR